MAGEFTQAQLDELTAQIAKAEIAIKHGDKAVNLATLAEQIALRDRMIRALNTTAQRPARHLAKFSRGDR